MEEQPYRPRDLIEIVKIPQGIKTPESDSGVVKVAEHIYEASPQDEYKFPSQYSDLEAFFLEQYRRSTGIDIEPFSMDLLFQQYAIKKDEELGRNVYNTFGLYTPSYLKGLESYFNPRGAYFEASSGVNYPKKALLMGCSSLSTANEFMDFVHGMRPDVDVVIADIDPVAVKIASLSGAKTIQADAQRIPLEDGSVDFIATNWLVVSLRDRMGTGKNSIVEVINELSRVLNPNTGRLVMVEMLTKLDAEWLVHYAFEAGLGLRQDFGKSNAVILGDRRRITWALDRIQHDLHDPTYSPEHRISENIGGRKQDGVYSLVFSKWLKPGDRVIARA